MNKTFDVTEDHIKLLGRIYFGYNGYTEFGAPEVDPKRPYGNSDVYDDIAEILDIPREGEVDSWGDREFSAAQRNYMDKVHREMTTVLQILAKNLGIETGRYQVDSSYGNDWSKV